MIEYSDEIEKLAVVAKNNFQNPKYLIIGKDKAQEMVKQFSFMTSYSGPDTVMATHISKFNSQVVGELEVIEVDADILELAGSKE